MRLTILSLLFICLLSGNAISQTDSCKVIHLFYQQLLATKKMEIANDDSVFIYTELSSGKECFISGNVFVDAPASYGRKKGAVYSFLLTKLSVDGRNVTEIYFEGHFGGYVTYDGWYKMAFIENRWVLLDSWLIKGID